MGRTLGGLSDLAGNGVCEGWFGDCEEWLGDCEGWCGDCEGWCCDSEGKCGDCEGCGVGGLIIVLLFISLILMTVDLLTELSRGDFKIVSGTNVIVSDFIEADVVSSYSFSSVCVRRLSLTAPAIVTLLSEISAPLLGEVVRPKGFPLSVKFVGIVIRSPSFPLPTASSSCSESGDI